MLLLLVSSLIAQHSTYQWQAIFTAIAVVVILLMTIGLAMSGLWPVAMSLLGGVLVYGRPVLRAFGLWQTVKRFTQPNPNSNAPIASVMDKPQARRILEVDDNASREEIVTVLKRLIAKNH